MYDLGVIRYKEWGPFQFANGDSMLDANLPSTFNRIYSTDEFTVEARQALTDSRHFVGNDMYIREVGGWIIEGSNGSYTYKRFTGPATSNSIESGPRPPNAVGTYHTHVVEGTRDYIAHPSSGDVNASKHQKLPGAVVSVYGITVYAHRSVPR